MVLVMQVVELIYEWVFEQENTLNIIQECKLIHLEISLSPQFYSELQFYNYKFSFLCGRLWMTLPDSQVHYWGKPKTLRFQSAVSCLHWRRRWACQVALGPVSKSWRASIFFITIPFLCLKYLRFFKNFLRYPSRNPYFIQAAARTRRLPACCVQTRPPGRRAAAGVSGGHA